MFNRDSLPPKIQLTFMKNWLIRQRKWLPEPIWRALTSVSRRWFAPWVQQSFAQSGEDLILKSFLLEEKPYGFYVDVGAHHPKRFSNTYRLYRRGWRGINIDATPGSMAAFRRARPRDINIEAAIGPPGRELRFFLFKDGALNTCDPKLMSQHAAEGRPPIKEVVVETKPLSAVLVQHVPPNVTIDLMTVDVEGADYDVLASNDWNRYSPEYILVECLETLTLAQVRSLRIDELLSAHHYSAVAKSINTLLYKRMAGGVDAAQGR